MPLNLLNYRHYLLQYVAKNNVNVIILQFEFNTEKNGSWYLDDVSMKEKNGDGTELIKDGDFESGSLDPHWDPCSTLGIWVSGSITYDSPHSGQFCYKSMDSDSEYIDFLSQRVNIRSGAFYEIQFYVFHSDKPNWMRVTVRSP
jgi:hypothetical protein